MSWSLFFDGMTSEYPSHIVPSAACDSEGSESCHVDVACNGGSWCSPRVSAARVCPGAWRCAVVYVVVADVHPDGVDVAGHVHCYIREEASESDLAAGAGGRCAEAEM